MREFVSRLRSSVYMAGNMQTFRANVGLAIVNVDFDVLALERAIDHFDANGAAGLVGSGQWLMPQGGLRVGEEPAAAAVRVLGEELGLGNGDADLLFECPQWLAYELPEETRSEDYGRGQVQKWFFLRLLADASRIDLRGNGSGRAYHQYRWMSLAQLLNRTWRVRQPVYHTLLVELDRYKARNGTNSWEI